MKKFDYFIGVIAVIAFFLLMAELSSYFSAYTHIFRMINLTILCVFILDLILRLFISKNKIKFIKKNPIDFIVFIPLIQFFYSFENTPFFVIVWQVVIVTILISRLRKVNKLFSLLRLQPTQLMVSSFIFAIGVGTILLMLPAATVTGEKTSLINAAFTATSATCVTGLIVKDTATYFSLFGQMVILALIQIGGLGIMTFSVSLSILLKKRIKMHQQVVMKDVLDQDEISTIKRFVLFIFKMTFLVEIIGALFLFFSWNGRFENKLITAYHALFHSVSAFCNAGFSTFSDSLIQFSDSFSTNFIISMIIIFGGLGFIVINDVFQKIKNHVLHRTKKIIQLKVQTKLVLGMSIFLILLGGIFIYFVENNQAFESLSLKSKIFVSLFQSVATRTAGFNSFDIPVLSSATLLFMIVLMFIGGSPGSTAGGVKTTTIAVLWATIKSGFKQNENVELHKRTIPNEIIKKAITILASSLMIILIFAISLACLEKFKFVDILFETVSAFATVGLSTGITPHLSISGKVLLSILMFIGRLGPLTIGYAFANRTIPARYKYAEERIMIG